MQLFFLFFFHVLFPLSSCPVSVGPDSVFRTGPLQPIGVSQINFLIHVVYYDDNCSLNLYTKFEHSVFDSTVYVQNVSQ